MASSESSRPDELVRLAHRAMEGAYAPYSGFQVGAALEDEDGRRFTGCNVENASYPVTVCAERVALGTAVAAGARRFRRLAICSSGRRPASPCGMCRQALAEFGLDVEVVSVTPDGKHARWNLEDLLPESFSLRQTGRATPGSGGGSERSPDAGGGGVEGGSGAAPSGGRG